MPCPSTSTRVSRGTESWFTVCDRGSKRMTMMVSERATSPSRLSVPSRRMFVRWRSSMPSSGESCAFADAGRRALLLSTSASKRRKLGYMTTMKTTAATTSAVSTPSGMYHQRKRRRPAAVAAVVAARPQGCRTAPAAARRPASPSPSSAGTACRPADLARRRLAAGSARTPRAPVHGSPGAARERPGGARPTRRRPPGAGRCRHGTSGTACLSCRFPLRLDRSCPAHVAHAAAPVDEGDGGSGAPASTVSYAFSPTIPPAGSVHACRS